MCKFCVSDSLGISDIKAAFTTGDANGDGSSADEWLLSLLLLLTRDTSAQLSQMTLAAFADAAAQLPALYRPLLDKLADAHANAAYLGRRKAGVLDTFNQRDIDFGRLAAAEQAKYLQRFVEDLKNGRYTNADGTPKKAQIEARWQQYQKRVVGSANEAWAFSLPNATKIYWVSMPGENCATCPALASASPFTPATLPTVPRTGGTECGVNCNCYLRTEAGATSFQI